jgi:hypothetical protein
VSAFSNVGLGEISALILAVGAFGAAAYGIVEAFGKASASSHWKIIDEASGQIAPKPRVATLWTRFRGLPYVGFSAVQDFMHVFAPALKAAYGLDYQKIVLGQYRNGRGSGDAPGTIRQGVRMGLALLSPTELSDMIAQTWGLSRESSTALAEAISARNAALAESAEPVSDARTEGLMASFVTALDARLDAAFSLAEERYLSAARTWAAVTSVVLVLALNYIALYSKTGDGADEPALPWEVALFIGVVAVPLAPISKDLAKAISEAVGAFRSFKLSR